MDARDTGSGATSPEDPATQANRSAWKALCESTTPMLAAFSDLNMLVGPGGRERTEAEYAAIFAAAGLRRSRTVRTATGFAVIEAVADSEAGPPTP